MPVFCAEFGWCSPDAFWALEFEDFERLSAFLVKRAEDSERASRG